MERTYESAAAFVGRAAGPLASHLRPFVTSLIDQQYTASVIYIKVRHALVLCQTLNPVGYRPRGFAAFCWDGPDAKSGTFRFSAIPCHSGARSSHVSRGTAGGGLGWSVGRFR
jgi:hypothetical protein